jgi:hypothetical protein
MGRRRDEFNESTKRLLRERVGGLCSNPECKVFTTGPSATDRVSMMGVAAHINAASKGGPRYDRMMTREMRRSFHNGLWLCSNCSIKIDKDPAKFTAEDLRKWRDLAERSAYTQLGVKPLQDDDISAQMAMVLGRVPDKPFVTGVTNVLNAAVSSLARLDDRVHVSIAHADERNVCIDLRAKKPITLKFEVSGASSVDLTINLQRLCDDGIGFSLQTSDLAVEGSALFKSIVTASPDGIVKFGPNAKRCKLNLVAYDDHANALHTIEGFDAEITAGSRSLRIEASGYGGIVSIEGCIENHNIACMRSLNISIQVDQWKMKDIRRLPYADNARLLLQALCKNNWGMVLEINGIPMAKMMPEDGDELRKSGLVQHYRSLFEYLRNAVEVATKLNTAIAFDDSMAVEQEAFLRLSEVANLLRSPKILRKSDLSQDMTMVVTGESTTELVRLAEQSGEVIPIRVESDEPSIAVFGQSISLPNRVHEILGAKLGLSVNQHDLPVGGVRLTCIRTSDFALSVFFDGYRC